MRGSPGAIEITPVDAQLKRVVVVGTGCSGKITPASELARKPAAPHIELDAPRRKPNRKPAAKEEIRSSVAAAAAREVREADGNHSAVRDIRVRV